MYCNNSTTSLSIRYGCSRRCWNSETCSCAQHYSVILVLGVKNITSVTLVNMDGCKLFSYSENPWSRYGCVIYVFRESVTTMFMLSFVTQSGEPRTKITVVGDSETSVKFYYDGNSRQVYVKCNYTGGTQAKFLFLSCPSAEYMSSLDVSGMTEITRS